MERAARKAAGRDATMSPSDRSQLENTLRPFRLVVALKVQAERQAQSIKRDAMSYQGEQHLRRQQELAEAEERHRRAMEAMRTEHERTVSRLRAERSAAVAEAECERNAAELKYQLFELDANAVLDRLDVTRCGEIEAVRNGLMRTLVEVVEHHNELVRLDQPMQFVIDQAAMTIDQVDPPSSGSRGLKRSIDEVDASPTAELFHRLADAGLGPFIDSFMSFAMSLGTRDWNALASEVMVENVFRLRDGDWDGKRRRLV